MLHCEVIFLAELAPIVLLGVGQYEDDADGFAVLTETLYGSHQDRLAVNGEELLRQVAAHTQSLSSCHNDDIVLVHTTRTSCLFSDHLPLSRP